MKKITQKEIDEYRYSFPVTKKYIYLNHAGVAPISRRVADAVTEFNQEALFHGYTAGGTWVKHFETVREKCAQLINAVPEEIAFIKNTSHGISIIARGLGLKQGDEVILSDLEFPANVYPWMALEKSGVRLKKIPHRDGELVVVEMLVDVTQQVVSQTEVPTLFARHDGLADTPAHALDDHRKLVNRGEVGERSDVGVLAR